MNFARKDGLSDAVMKLGKPPVAVFGCGEWGSNIVRHFAQLGALRAFSDASPATAKRFEDKLKVPAWSIDEILADPDITAVAVATPAPMHAEHVTRALEAGKHVFVEKPLALTVADGEKLADLAKRKNLTLMVGHLLQYHPAFVALLDLIRSGELGKIQYVYAHRTNIGTVRHEENVIWSLAPHDISMILAIFDAMPEKVSADTSCILNPAIADIATIHMTFPQGASAHVFASWLNPYKERRLVVVGEHAHAVFDDALAWTEKLVVHRHRIDTKTGRHVAIRGSMTAVSVSERDVLHEELLHFLDCVANGTPPRTGPVEALRVLRVLEAASPLGAKALKTGQTQPNRP